MTPWRFFAVVATAALVSGKAVGSFVDVDVYWHVDLGREMLQRRQVTGTGTDWAFGMPDAVWTSTQWLSEIVFALAHMAGGWAGIAALRVGLAVTVAGALALLLLRGRRSPWAVIVFVLVLVLLSTAFQERPQTISLVFLAWLSGQCHAAMRGRPTARWWVVLSLTALWANLHGLWILVPVCLGAVAFGRMLEAWGDLPATAQAVRLWVNPLAAVAAGCLTPVGPALLLSPVRFASATKHIQEWQPTMFDKPYVVVYGVLLLVLVAANARSSRVGVAEIVFVLGIATFSFMAVRNVYPAAVLLAPLVVDRLDEVWPRRDRVNSLREARVLTALASCLVLFLAAQGMSEWRRTPHVPTSTPVPLIETVAQLPGEHRLLNDYAISGAAIHWGGDDVKVAVDGRADRYGSDYIGSYKAMMGLRGDWADLLRELRPDAAILDESAPLVHELTTHQRWRQIAQHGDYVLLLPPD